jgi:predicted ArsR family transcriptional regulator
VSQLDPRNRRKHEVLLCLADHGPCKTGELVAECQTSRSNIHNVLRRLRDQGRVESSGGDPKRGSGRDEMEHYITPAGEELLGIYEDRREG